MNVRAVLLDLGNVLVFHDNAVLVQRIAERGGVSTARVEQALTQPLWDDLNRGRVGPQDLRAKLSQVVGDELSPDEARDLWSSHFTFNTAVFPYVEALLGQVKVLLLSNTNALHMSWVRPRLPLLDRFDALVLSHEVGMAKPDPGIYHEALRRAGVSPGEACFFDDIPEFVEAARALGIRAEVFTTVDAFRRQLAALGLATLPA
ncbi:MAG TPA: HAD family phosphatase [Myxococcaceae bacterium]|nr:HAD family phosphatase [Myxococcaceae bacterium]